MINSIFTDTFNFLASSLNNLNENQAKSKNRHSSDSLKRLIDTVQFVYNKRTTFNTDLAAIKHELLQMKKEAVALKNDFSKWTTNSLVFTIESLIDSLILEVDVEINKRKAKEQEKQDTKQNTDNNSNQLKVKVFKSAFSDVIENEMNFFLSRNDVEIVNTLQTVEKEVVCITLFYK